MKNQSFFRFIGLFCLFRHKLLDFSRSSPLFFACFKAGNLSKARTDFQKHEHTLTLIFFAIGSDADGLF